MAFRALLNLAPRDLAAAVVMAVFLYAIAVLLEHPDVVAAISGGTIQ